MNDGLLLVNFGALQQASLDIQKALTELSNQLTQLERDAGPLVATWEGSAQAAYRERQARWQNAAGELSEILRNIKLAVDESAADYQDTERRATNRFQ
ncbi:MAG TPA: WXG100 family type VII secretion target [Actinoplanes sp.]|nr:WXG100 family type VII secretion target [Actinoplanes sp.]